MYLFQKDKSDIKIFLTKGKKGGIISVMLCSIRATASDVTKDSNAFNQKYFPKDPLL